MREDLTARHGATALEVGIRVRITSLEAHRADWKRAVRSIVIISVTMCVV